MASYKVPQDVEAEDKLIGPFGFRQFIYLIIVALAGVLAWGLAQIFILLALLPLPIILLFGALALPLRKDQPMEIYLAAMVSFYLKPRKRFWDPEGVDSLIDIAAPRTDELAETTLSEEDAQERISYLANIVDSRGWAIRGMAGAETPNTPLNQDTYYEARQVEDILDDSSTRAQDLTIRMDETAERLRQDAISRMKQITVPEEPQKPNPFLNDSPTPATFNPYPAGINQAYVAPLDQSDDNQATTSGTPPTADIMNLVNNADGLSVAAVSKEANRLSTKDSPDEVSISLR